VADLLGEQLVHGCGNGDFSVNFEEGMDEVLLAKIVVGAAAASN